MRGTPGRGPHPNPRKAAEGDRLRLLSIDEPTAEIVRGSSPSTWPALTYRQWTEPRRHSLPIRLATEAEHTPVGRRPAGHDGVATISPEDVRKARAKSKSGLLTTALKNEERSSSCFRRGAAIPARGVRHVRRRRADKNLDFAGPDVWLASGVQRPRAVTYETVRSTIRLALTVIAPMSEESTVWSVFGAR